MDLCNSQNFNILISFMCQIKTGHFIVRLKHAVCAWNAILACPPRARHRFITQIDTSVRSKSRSSGMLVEPNHSVVAERGNRTLNCNN
jgi:hypothetical protein